MRVRGVIARPFGERAFQAGLFRRWRHESLERHFGVGRDRQAGEFALDHVDRASKPGAGAFVFALAVLRGGRRHHAEHRRLTDHHHHRAWLAHRPPFLADQAAMLARFDEDRQRALVLHHHTISADVHPARIRILVDDEDFGADVTATVLLMPVARREFRNIDRVAAHNVLGDGTALDDARRKGLAAALATRAKLLQRVQRQIAREQAREAYVHEHAKAGRMARDVLEQQERRILLLQAQFVERAHFEIGIGATQRFQFAARARDTDQFAQIAQRRLPVLVFHVQRHESLLRARLSRPRVPACAAWR